MKLTKRAQSIKPSPTLAITAKANRMKAEGIDVVGFGAGEPDFDTPDNIKEAAIKAIKSGFTKYTPSSGIDELKDAIIEKFRKENNLKYERNQVVICCGAKDVLYNIAQVLFEEGDEVIIPAPYWVSYPDQVVLAGGTPVFVPTKEENGFRITGEDFKKAITSRTRAIIINSPSNPTGGAYEAKHLEEIGEIALKNNLTIISDEIYERMVYDGFKHVSMASLSDKIKEITLVVNGVSKTYSMTGWRIGYVVGDKNVISAIVNLQSQSTSNPTSISQKASVEALRGDQSTVDMMVKAFDERRKYIVKRLNSIKGVSCYNPQGAFYVFPNFSKLYGKKLKDKVINSSSDLAELLLEVKVAVVPGVAFGDDAYIRLSYATSMDNIKKGIDRIEEFVGKLS
ncbi:MAG: aspartate aminotransferase [Candidatus Schekmanbacteria bacterium RBG_16_38_11]|uniref:Aminotransferase n=1 Tax=Candidatus Schekmanbacteria bacterium RBG_16_38_11 TaxID=1817880 RepID=A0A1F7S1M3_9BACT|nr:MAG: aspartate aminotransferase [Candidatus Schekmanbacteria bacterium RBG_16_38_11]